MFTTREERSFVVDSPPFPETRAVSDPVRRVVRRSGTGVGATFRGAAEMSRSGMTIVIKRKMNVKLLRILNDRH